MVNFGALVLCEEGHIHPYESFCFGEKSRIKIALFITHYTAIIGGRGVDYLLVVSLENNLLINCFLERGHTLYHKLCLLVEYAKNSQPTILCGCCYLMLKEIRLECGCIQM